MPITVTPINGIPSFSYAWWISTNGGANWSYYTTTTGSSTSTVNFTMPNAQGLMVRVLATSSFAETAIGFKIIANNGIPQICCQNNFRTAPGIQNEEVVKEKGNLLQVYPNPSSEYINISWSLAVSKLTGDERIVITDMLGNIVYEKQVFSAKFTHQLRLASFASGSYIVNLVSRSGIAKQKITVVK